MIGLDTNVLARFFLQDDLQQSARADEIMESLSILNPGFVGIATILELAWVLSSKSRLERKSIVDAMDRLILLEEVVIEQPDTVQRALWLFRRGNADFADCLIACTAQAAGCSKTVTFDRKAARDCGMELLA